MRTVLFFLFFQLCTALLGVSFVWAAEESMEEKAADYEEELLDDLDTRQMQRIMDELLEEDSFSFKEIVRELMENGQAITGEQALELVEESFWKLFGENRGVFGQVLLLAFAAALMSSFVQAFDREKMGDSCFYMIYLLVFVLLLKEFRDMSGELHGVLTGIVKFMQALAPSYYIVVSAAAGVTTASLFYQIILIAIFCVEYILVTFLFPAVHIYVLLEFINLMTKEAMLSRIGELLRGGILWVQKTLLAVIAGMQIIQSLSEAFCAGEDGKRHTGDRRRGERCDGDHFCFGSADPKLFRSGCADCAGDDGNRAGAEAGHERTGLQTDRRADTAGLRRETGQMLSGHGGRMHAAFEAFIYHPDPFYADYCDSGKFAVTRW